VIQGPIGCGEDVHGFPIQSPPAHQYEADPAPEPDPVMPVIPAKTQAYRYRLSSMGMS